MGQSKNIPYYTIVDQVRQACDEHIAIASFDTGTIDYLDSSSVNRLYPYIFLRPMSANILDKQRILTFEIYSLDKPTDRTQNHTDIMSDTELYLYDLQAWFNQGPAIRQQVYLFNFNSIIPVNEAFQDRLFGWMGNVEIITPWSSDYCGYPKL